MNDMFTKMILQLLEKAQAEAEKETPKEDCECLVCTIMRDRKEGNKPKAPEEAKGASEKPVEGRLMQTVASVVINNQIASTGFSVDQDADVLPVVGLRFGENQEAYPMTPDEARLLGQALITTANKAEDE